MFVNYKPSDCGCKIKFSEGYGSFSDIIYVDLCSVHDGGYSENDEIDKMYEPFSDFPVMPKINGKSFSCECGCNVFTKSTVDPNVFKCNACRALYDSK